MITAETTEPDGYAARFGKPLFSSLWTKAWGDSYPADVQPFSSCTQELLRQLVEQVCCSAESVLVDFGCGAGGVGLWVARESGCQVIGVDRSMPAVEIAADRARDWGLSDRAAFRLGQFVDTGLASDSVDAVISIDALPFEKDVDAALAEVRRILRGNGRLVFTTRELSASAPDYARLGPAWSAALARNGFRTIDVHERAGVSELWRTVYDQWLMHEEGLRAELGHATVDRMLDEVREIGPKLDEDRPWLLITACVEAEGRPGR